MSPEKRRALMSRIRGKDTGPERMMAGLLEHLGLSWETHAKDLPGRPDFVFRDQMVAVFVDGDFWHGWRFPLWQVKLTDFWRQKIQATRCRDHRNFRRLRRMKWKVVRIWEHQLMSAPRRCLERVQAALVAQDFHSLDLE